MYKFRFSFLILVASIVWFATSCDKETAKDKLTVSEEELEFIADDTEDQFVEVETNVKGWTVSRPSSARWITIEKEDDGFFVSVDKNTGTSDRYGTITVKAGEATPVTVEVVQLAAVAGTLSLNLSSLHYAANETGTKTVTVTTNASNWDAQVSSDWLTTQKSGNTLIVNALSLNTGSSQRVAVITITAGNANPVTLTVTQEVTPSGGTTLSVSQNSFTFEASETSTKSAIITTNASSWNFTNSDNSWLTVARQGATNTLNITPNSQNSGSAPRSSTITITASSANPVTISVTQKGKGSSGSSFPPTGYYTAKTGASMFSVAPNTWTGIYISGEDFEYDFGLISNFLGDEDFDIFVDYKDGKIYLDDYSDIWEGTLSGLTGTYLARLVCGVKYNGSNYSLNASGTQQIYYNSNTGVLDFSNKVNVNFGGTIGTINDLTLYVGVMYLPKSGTGSKYWYDASPDIKLTITAASFAPSSKSNNSVSSKSMPQKKPLSNRVKTIDVSKLTPFAGEARVVE